MRDNAPNQVIILGAGPVGLAVALELARFGVPSVLIERHDGTSRHPKTRYFNTRTMEIARGWGPVVYKRLRSIDMPPGWKSPIRFLHSATGREFGRIESKGFEGPGPAVSPCEPVMSSQDLIEEILLDAVCASGLVDVRLGVEATRLVAGGGDADTEAALEVTDLRTGAREVVTGAALVAADGASSLIRSQLGLALEGRQGLSRLVNCYFRADLERHIGDRKGVMFFVANQSVRGVLQPLDGSGRWLCQMDVPPADWSPEVFTSARARNWVCAAAGVQDLEMEILSLGFWQLNATIVERFVKGRVVLCGDAAHQFPPAGGLGVNTGLQGMHNVMWKLAYCLRGEAGWPLLHTYHDERRSVSQSIMSQSLQNAMNAFRIVAAAATGEQNGLTAEDTITASRRFGNHLGVELGAAYASAAVVPDGTQPPAVADDYSDYEPSATPGCRAPHFWLGRRDAQFSTLELFGPSFTLLAAPAGDAWCDAAARAERALGVRIVCYRIGAPGLHDPGGFGAAYGVNNEGAVLVRPDGYVAWRSASAPVSGDELGDALRQILVPGR